MASGQTKIGPCLSQNGATPHSLTLDRGAAVLLLDAGFPVPAAPATSGFPLSPLALLAAGRADFFMLSSLTLVHGQLALNTEEGRRKVKDVRMRSDCSNFPRKKKFFPPTAEREKKKINRHHTRKHLSVSAIKVEFGSCLSRSCSGNSTAAESSERFKGDGFNPGLFTTRTDEDHPGEHEGAEVCLH